MDRCLLCALGAAACWLLAGATMGMAAEGAGGKGADGTSGEGGKGGKEFVHSPIPVPTGLEKAEFRLYLPSSIKKDDQVRGIIAAADYHAGKDIYTDARWRKLAGKLHFAMLLHNVTRPSDDHPLAKDEAGLYAILQALKHFAEASGHGEIAHIGIVHTGLSQSAAQATAFCNVRPDRAIAAVAYHSSSAVRDPNACKGPGTAVPQLHLIAEKDQFLQPATIQEFVLKARGRGALWAACFQAQVEHHRLGEADFILAWVEEVANLRLPETVPADRACPLRALAEKDGWLGVLKWDGGHLAAGEDAASVWPYAAFTGERTAAHWLPGQSLAKAWREYNLRKDAREASSPPATQDRPGART